MTAIAVAYDPEAGRFVVSADGRCSSSGVPMVIKTDKQQKIFFAETNQMTVIYAMTGLSSIGASSCAAPFDTMAEAHEQIRILASRSFQNGYQFAHRFCTNLAKAFEAAVKDGRIPRVPISEELSPEEKGRIFRFFLFGYFKGLAFWRLTSFYYAATTNSLSQRIQDFELTEPRFASTGSETIMKMFFGAVPMDPRIARYKPRTDKGADALEATANFVKACSDPNAVEIDPWCRIVGGHLHAAEVTKSGFRWLIPPLADSETTL